MTTIKNLLVKGLIFIIKVYQKAISPLLPARCRYYPTCSVYGMHALSWHGVRGVPLVVMRILRCQPWGGSGVDFVPLPLYRYRFVACWHWISFVLKDTTSYRIWQNRLMKG